MWDRKELKAKGKAAYNANKVACIIAALILMIAGGIGSGSTASPSVTVRNQLNSNDQVVESYDDSRDGNDVVTVEVNGQNLNIGETEHNIVPMIAVSSVVFFLILIASTVGLMVLALVLNPLHVGARKFFIQNASDPGTKVDGMNVGFAFGKNYRDIVFSMFGTQLINILWTLLLIVPGIYKAYCWRLVPFIIADEPDIPGKEARARSASMMNGSKWASFVLDLSFIGWKLVGALTFGIVNIVFTNPYEAATDTELYLTLKG
ncbi:MAG: DUF975 family protein [Mogibacterium sp.]|nr:DUF975 family protein [Mogibacterium sp.]